MILLGCQLAELLMYLALLAKEDERKTDPVLEVRFSGAREGNTLLGQVLVTILCIILAVYAFLFTIGTFIGDNMTRLFDFVLLKAVVITVLNTFLLAEFVISRVVLLAIIITLQFVEISIAFSFNWRIHSASEDRESLRDVPTIMRSILKMRPATSAVTEQHSEPLTMHLLEKLLTWLSGQDAARTFSGNGRKHMVRIWLVLLALMLTGFGTDLRSILRTDDSLLAEDDYKAITNATIANLSGWTYSADDEPNRLTPVSGIGSHRVVVLMFDGIGYNQFVTSDEISSLLSNDDYAEDLFTLRVEAKVATGDMPTWQQLISGIEPESTGQRGTFGIGYPSIDTLFHRASDTGVQVAVASFPWFQYLFQNSLGANNIASLAANLREDPGHDEISASQDSDREKIVIQAMQSSNNFDLIWGHFVNPNYQAYQHGVHSDEYRAALASVATTIENVLRAVPDSSFTVMVVSNHGNLYGGGYGGGTAAVTEVPLMVYKRDSGIREQQVPSLYPRNVDRLPSLTDVCPSIAAMLGIPVPRHNQGVFIEELLTSNLVHPDTLQAMEIDLLAQQQEFTRRWIQKMGYVAEQFSLSSKLRGASTPGPSQTVYDIRNLRQETSWQLMRNLRLRNILCMLVIIFTVTLVWAYIFQTLTIADPFAALWYRLHSRLLEWVNTPDFRSARLAALCVISYYAIVWAIFFFLSSLVFQSQFDASFLHKSATQVYYVLLVFLPGLLTSYVISRLVAHHLRHVDSEAPVVTEPSLLKQIWGIFADDVTIIEVAYHQMFHLYLLFFSLSVCLWLLFVSSTEYGFIVPTTFRLTRMTESHWATHFRAMTAVGMSIPLLLFAGISVYLHGFQPVDDYMLYEINRIRSSKAQRYKEFTHIDLGESQKNAWELPNIDDENPDAPATKIFERLSDWCIEVAASTSLSAAEKRRLVTEQYDKFSAQLRYANQEKQLVKRQLDAITSDMNERRIKIAQMEAQVTANSDLQERRVEAVRERVQRDMAAEARTRQEMGKKVPWRTDPITEENRRIGQFVMSRLHDHEEKKQAIQIEASKMWLLNQNRSQFESDLANIRKQQRDIVEQTMLLVEKNEALEETLVAQNQQLDEIVARIKEFETVKKRVADSINKDILVHRQIQREILDELKKEGDYHMYVHNLIDSVSEEIEDKESKIQKANTDSHQIEARLEQEIMALNEGIEAARKQKMELFREVKSTIDQLNKTKSELRSNLKWASEYKLRLGKMTTDD